MLLHLWESWEGRGWTPPRILDLPTSSYSSLQGNAPLHMWEGVLLSAVTFYFALLPLCQSSPAHVMGK